MDSEVGQTARWGIGGETDFAAPTQGGDLVEEVVGVVEEKKSRFVWRDLAVEGEKEGKEAVRVHSAVSGWERGDKPTFASGG